MRDILIVILLIAVFGWGIVFWPVLIIAVILLVSYIVSLRKRKQEQQNTKLSSSAYSQITEEDFDKEFNDIESEDDKYSSI